MQWLVSQIGAREHYAVPRALQRAGRLRKLYTEIWCPQWVKNARPLRSLGRGLISRRIDEIPDSLVRSFGVGYAVNQTIASLKRRRGTQEEGYHRFIQIGEWFDGRVVDCASRLKFDPMSDALFAFNTGCLRSLQLFQERGCLAVVDQIDPAKVEEEIVHGETEKWRGWQARSGRIPQAYWDRLGAEWQTADVVIVNSNWSRDALARQGVPVGKIAVIPCAYDAPTAPSPVVERRTGPLRVLWLGSVILRKGIPYLIEAARMLRETSIEFTVAGPVMISDSAVASAPANMKFIGRVTRDRAGEVYRGHDLFVLPTMSDGFALTQVEAMASGLPVITTPNCGDVVSDGVDGLIVPAGDAAALAEAILKLDKDRDLLVEMSHRALAKPPRFSLGNYAGQLEEVALRAREKH